MDSYTIGSGFFVVGVGMVIASSFLLRRNKAQEKTDADNSRQLAYTWIGRVGTALAIIGFLIALKK